MAPSVAAPDTRSTELADGAVVRAVLAGDVERYEVLVARYQERLYRYALGMVLDRDTATEIAQDTLVTSYEKLRGCRDPDRFGAWVFRTLRNRCLDHLKDPRRRHVPIQTQANRLVADEGDAAEAALRAIALYRPLHSALEDCRFAHIIDDQLEGGLAGAKARNAIALGEVASGLLFGLFHPLRFDLNRKAGAVIFELFSLYVQGLSSRRDRVIITAR